MEDNRFSEVFLKAIHLTPSGGETMIAISRAVLRNSYSDSEYENEFFSTFILIDEESGEIVLDGFGEFNVATDRHSLTISRIENTINILSRLPANIEPHSNSRLYQGEIEDIARSYREQFLDSLRDFKAYFKLEGDSETKAR